MHVLMKFMPTGSSVALMVHFCCLLIALSASSSPLYRLPASLRLSSSSTTTEKQIDRLPPRRPPHHHQHAHHHHRHHHHHRYHHHHHYPEHQPQRRHISTGGLRQFESSPMVEGEEGEQEEATSDMIVAANDLGAAAIAGAPKPSGIPGRLYEAHHDDEPGEGRRSRREALHLAVNRLRILESLDDQLRAFALDLARRKQSPAEEAQSSLVTHCELPLEFVSQKTSDAEIVSDKANKSRSFHYETSSSSGQVEVEPEEAPEQKEIEKVKSQPSCLSSDHLRRQIPAYMLNLHKKLKMEANSLQEAVRLMPYGSLRMRSFRQPPALGHPRAPPTILADDWPLSSSSSSSSSEPSQEVLFEAKLHPCGSIRPGQLQLPLRATSSHQAQNLPEEAFMRLVDGRELVVELSAVMATASPQPIERPPYQPSNGIQRRKEAEGEGSASLPVSACDLGERLRPARDRTQLCYWFRLDRPAYRQVTSTIDGSLSSLSSLGSSSMMMDEIGQRLIEAELHLFKLQPDASLLRPHRHQPANSSLTGNGLHLRTNLLEVSLYQILKKKSGQSENPLRLLDIRRIDLYSSGWESFYVKRAVQDWLSDSSSNLGLVIKAKSMFDEPIRIGLIRFADLYDHYWSSMEKSQMEEESWMNASKNIEPQIEFDLSHQPALVIYTSG